MISFRALTYYVIVDQIGPFDDINSYSLRSYYNNDQHNIPQIDLMYNFTHRSCYCGKFKKSLWYYK